MLIRKIDRFVNLSTWISSFFLFSESQSSDLTFQKKSLSNSIVSFLMEIFKTKAYYEVFKLNI